MDLTLSELEYSQLTSPTAIETAKKLGITLKDMNIQMPRTLEVMKLFEQRVLRTEIELDVLESAILWAMAVLANNEDREFCKIYFFAFIDLIYAASDHAQKKFTQDEYELIYAKADERIKRLGNRINIIGNSVLEHASKLGKYDEIGETITLLNTIRSQMLEHVLGPHRLELIVYSLWMCIANDMYLLKLGSEEDLGKAITRLTECAEIVFNTVFAAVKAKILIVRDGKLVKNE